MNVTEPTQLINTFIMKSFNILNTNNSTQNMYYYIISKKLGF
jgi:hypothetical protein